MLVVFGFCFGFSLLMLVVLGLFVVMCAGKQKRRGSGSGDSELYESSTADDADDDGDEESRKGGVLYDADGNRRAFEFMCHHCGKLVAADEVVWAAVGGARVPPWRASYEQARSGKAHYIQTIAKDGATRVSACDACNALSNDAVRYTPPPELVRAEEESRKRYLREKDIHMAQKAAAKAAADAAGVPGLPVSPRLTPRREENVYVPGDNNADSVIISKPRAQPQQQRQDTYDKVVFDAAGAGALPQKFVFCADCDESDIDYRDIDRYAAESIIETAPPGSYIVRPSSKANGLSMTYYDIDAGKIKNVMLRHEKAGWITDGVEQHFPSLTGLRDHILLAVRFAEPGVNFQPLDRAAAEEHVRKSENQHYLVRPTSTGDLCLTVLLQSAGTGKRRSLRHVILQHGPNGWRATGLAEGPFATVKELFAALPAEFDFPAQR